MSECIYTGIKDPKCIPMTELRAEIERLKAKLAKERDYSAETDARFHERNEMVTKPGAQVQSLTAELADKEKRVKELEGHLKHCAPWWRKRENAIRSWLKTLGEPFGKAYFDILANGSTSVCAQSRLTRAEQVIEGLVGALNGAMMELRRQSIDQIGTGRTLEAIKDRCKKTVPEVTWEAWIEQCSHMSDHATISVDDCDRAMAMAKHYQGGKVNYEQPRKRELDGRWHWTTMRDGGTWASGACYGGECVHHSADEARAHQTEYLKKRMLEGAHEIPKPSKPGDMLHQCDAPGCKEIAVKFFDGKGWDTAMTCADHADLSWFVAGNSIHS